MNMHVAPQNIEPASRRAQRMLDANDGDKARTIKELIKLAETQKTLRDTLIRLGATALVGNLICQERARIVRGADNASQVRFTTSGTIVTPPVMSPRQAEMRRSVARKNVVRAWLNFQLPTKGNKQLGKANAKEVGEAAEQYRRNSGDMQHKAAWLDAIRAKLPRGKTVAEVLDDGALDALYESVAA
jgi:hypothetical protein